MNIFQRRLQAAWYPIVCFVAVGCVHLSKKGGSKMALFWFIVMPVIYLLFPTEKVFKRVSWQPRNLLLAVLFIVLVIVVDGKVF